MEAVTTVVTTAGARGHPTSPPPRGSSDSRTLVDILRNLSIPRGSCGIQSGHPRTTNGHSNRGLYSLSCQPRCPRNSFNNTPNICNRCNSCVLTNNSCAQTSSCRKVPPILALARRSGVHPTRHRLRPPPPHQRGPGGQAAPAETPSRLHPRLLQTKWRAFQSTGHRWWHTIQATAGIRIFLRRHRYQIHCPPDGCPLHIWRHRRLRRPHLGRRLVPRALRRHHRLRHHHRHSPRQR